ncbi:hypothetical protein BKA61DRAFT_741078 [Leptodontidium sp. MPI-SDFR-AT-0119]|nr:hypothetical protein BKA61DRAFT_741078 [Leptodontidium sp. MPI-SDFR-AT-0119]
MLVSGLFYPFLCMLSLVSAQFPNCTKANTAFCETPVFGVTPNNIIFRCPYDQGQASPANCNDDLASVPPIGLKYSSCWESSPTAGDAQCTYECVAVTLPNGTSFYPLGCNQTTAVPTSGVLASTSLSYASSPTGGSATGSAATPKASHSGVEDKVQTGVWAVFIWVGMLVL